MAAITQPMTFQIFPRIPRNAGTYETLTAQIPEGVATVTVRDTNPDSFCSDPVNSFTFETQVSPDGGVTWETILREQWSGGTFINKFTGLTQVSHMHSTTSIPPSYVGRLIQGVLTLPSRMSVGIEATVSPAAPT